VRGGDHHLEPKGIEVEPAPRQLHDFAVELDADDARLRRERPNDASRTAAAQPEQQDAAPARGRKRQYRSSERIPYRPRRHLPRPVEGCKRAVHEELATAGTIADDEVRSRTPAPTTGSKNTHTLPP